MSSPSARAAVGTTPGPELITAALKLLAPWRRLTAPVFHGLDAIPATRPLLFVGNHTLLGVLDAPLLVAELYERKGLLLRALGDHAHFRVPLWGSLLTQLGVVDGTRDNCARLMEAGEAILVFPGGGREVAKRRGEKYRLVWKERLGFARLAIAHGCTIVPFAAVGVEDALDVVLDADDLMRSPLGRVVEKLGLRTDILMPVVKGIGPTPLPRPERLYFHVGAPIPTAEYGRRGDDDDAARALRDRVRAAVEQGIADLLAHRERDPERALLPRVAAGLGRRVARGRTR